MTSVTKTDERVEAAAMMMRALHYERLFTQVVTWDVLMDGVKDRWRNEARLVLAAYYGTGNDNVTGDSDGQQGSDT